MTPVPQSVPELLCSETAATYVTTLTDAVTLLGDRVRQVRAPKSNATEPEIRHRLDAIDLDTPAPDHAAAMAEVANVYLDHAVWFHDPKYLAHLNCPVAIPALAADVLASAVNTSVDTWDQSAAGTLIEQRLVGWTAGRIGFGPGADGVFTSGGTLSNLQALLLARSECTARGARLDQLRVLTSGQGHFSIRTAARLLGLPDDAVIDVPVDAGYRMDPAALTAVLGRLAASGAVPMAVVATAGTTDLGVIDPLRPLGEICDRHGIWFHVDAAYGGGLLVSRRRRHLLDGVELASSVTVDFHKCFFQPVSSSAIVVRDGRTLRHVTYHADYLNPASSPWPNQVDKSLQTTRRLDALKLWLTLRTLGADRIGDLFDTVVDLAAEVHGWLAAQPDTEVAVAPTLSTVLWRHRPAGTSAEQASALVPHLRAALFDRGEALVASTVHAGSAWLKFTLLNPAVTLADVQSVVGGVRREAARLVPPRPVTAAALRAAGPARILQGLR